MERIVRDKARGLGKGLILILSGYRALLSPWLPPSCRFVPTCSAYASEAIERYGAAKGIWMGLIRIFRCRPGNPGGHDPVR